MFNCTDRSVQRGVALATTLLTTMVLLILAGAFLSIQRSNFQLLGQSQNSIRATQIIQSGLNYALMRLDQEPAWGTPRTGPAPAFADSAAAVLESSQLRVYERNYCVVGVTPEGHFQIYFEPNPAHTSIDLHGRYRDRDIAADPQQPAAWRREWAPSLRSINRLNVPARSGVVQPPDLLRSVPPGSANLTVVGQCGNKLVSLDATVCKRYLIDASMLSQADLGIQLSGQFHIQSRDATANRIRSRERMLIPQASQVLFGDPLQTFLNQGSAITPRAILLGDQVTYSEASDHSLTLNMPSPSANLASNAAARLLANTTSRGRYQPESSEDVQVPDLTPEDLRQPIATPKAVAGGRYHFTAPNKVLWWADANHDVSDVASASEYVDFIPDMDSHRALPLKDYRLEVPDDSKVTFEGSTTITGRQPLSMAMGYTDGALGVDALASVQVKGDLDIDGAVVGSGTLVTTAEGSAGGHLKARGKSQLATTPDLQVTLYAEGSVRLGSAAPPFQAVTSLDWDALHLATTEYDAQNAGDQWGGSSGFNAWLGLIWPVKGGQVGTGSDEDMELSYPSLRDAPLGDAGAWVSKLKGKYPIYNDPAVKPLVDAAAQDWMSGTTYAAGFSYGRFMRIRDFLSQCQLADQAGTLTSQLATLDDNLDLSVLGGNNQARMVDMLDAMANQALSAGKSLQDYIGPGVSLNPMEALDPEGVDFRGLVYARQNFLADMGGHSFRVEGALVSRGALAILNASTVDSIYNGDYLKSLLSNQAGGATLSRMEVVFWNVR